MVPPPGSAGHNFGMKLFLASAAVLGAATFASVPTTLVVMANDDAAQESVEATDIVTEVETETDEPDIDELEPTDEPSVEPSESPTRGWQTAHPNNGNHSGWENGHHSYGEAVRAWALCVSTQGKENCGDKPTPPGKDKTQEPKPTEEPTPDAEPSTTEPDDEGNGQGQGKSQGKRNGPKPK
jgi:hypothetical protein